MNGVSKITTCEDVALITFSKVPNDIKVISHIFTGVAQAGINIDMISQTAPQGEFVSFSFTVMGDETIKVISLANSLKGHSGGIKPMVSTGNCKIQIYGQDMPKTPGVFAEVLAAVASSGADLNLVTTSEVDISLLLSTAHFHDALTTLETTFGVTAE